MILVSQPDDARLSLNPALCLVLALLAVLGGWMPDFISGTGTVMMVYYYWLMHRPDVLTRGYALAAGLVLDLWLAGPFGLYMALLMLLHEGGLRWRDLILHRPFTHLWAGAAVMLLVLHGAEAMSTASPLLPHIALQLVVDVCVFPVLSSVFAMMTARR